MPVPPFSLRARRLTAAAALALTVLASQAACTPPDDPAGAPTTPPTTATTTAPPTTTAPADPTAAWTRYSDPVDHFSLRYPTSWQQRTCPNGAHTGLFLAPASDSLAVCNSGFTGQMSVVAMDGDQRAALHVSGSGLTSSAVTVDGVAGVRETGTATAGDLGPTAGTRLVAYIFFTGGRTYRCSYNQAPSGPTSTDVLADFDLMVTATLRLFGLTDRPDRPDPGHRAAVRPVRRRR